MSDSLLMAVLIVGLSVALYPGRGAGARGPAQPGRWSEPSGRNGSPAREGALHDSLWLQLPLAAFTETQAGRGPVLSGFGWHIPLRSSHPLGFAVVYGDGSVGALPDSAADGTTSRHSVAAPISAPPGRLEYHYTMGLHLTSSARSSPSLSRK